MRISDESANYFLGPVSQGYFDFRVDRRLRPPRLIGSVENQDKNKADDELVWSALVLYLLECQVANTSFRRMAGEAEVSRISLL